MHIVHSPIPSKLAFITTYNPYTFPCLFGFRSAIDMWTVKTASGVAS